MAYYLDGRDLKNILDNFDTEVVDILRKYKNFDDNTTFYIENKFLGGRIWKFIFEWEYIDAEERDRTLEITICINLASVESMTWVDRDAKIKQSLPDKLKAQLRFAYLIWYVLNEVERSFYPSSSNSQLSDEICNSKSNQLRVLVFPNGGYKFEVLK